MEKWWAALTTFERRNAVSEILPEWAQGACGWMAAFADDEEGVRHKLATDLGQLDLRLLEVDRMRVLATVDEAADLDEHLASNMQELAPSTATVWGTIHCYKAEGEA